MGLDYDNSAFYYFSMTMLGIYVIPSTWWALGYIYRALVPGQRLGEEVRTSLEKDKAKQLKERRSARKLLTKTSFLLHIALLTVAWAILLMLIRAAIRVSRTFSIVDPN
jgi:translocation protein SEC63